MASAAVGTRAGASSPLPVLRRVTRHGGDARRPRAHLVRLRAHDPVVGGHLHGSLRDRRIGLLLDLRLPALPALRSVASRRGALPCGGSLLGAAAVADRARVLARVRGHELRARRQHAPARMALAAHLPGVRADLLPLARAHGHHPSVVTVHRGDLLPLPPPVRHGRRGAPALRSRPAATRGRRPGRNVRHRARRAVLAPARAPADGLRHARLAARVSRPVRSGHAPGGGEQLAGAPWPRAALALAPSHAVDQLGRSRGRAVGGVAPGGLAAPARAQSARPRHRPGGPVRALRAVPALAGGVRSATARRHPQVAGVAPGDGARRRLLRRLPVAPGVGDLVPALVPRSVPRSAGRDVRRGGRPRRRVRSRQLPRRRAPGADAQGPVGLVGTPARAATCARAETGTGVGARRRADDVPGRR